MNKPLLASDIDGVLVDWMSPFIEHINTHFGHDLTYDLCHTHNLIDLLGCEKEDVFHMIDHFDEHFGRDQHPFIPEGYQALQELQNHYELVFITSRPMTYEPTTRELIAKHFGSEVIFAHGAKMKYGSKTNRKRKFEIAEELGAVAHIEDNPHEFEGWNVSTKPLCHIQPWNKSLEETHPHIPRLSWSEIMKELKR